MGRQIAIMNASGIRMILRKDDLVSYFEQVSRHCRYWRMQMQLTSPQGISMDRTLRFGWVPEPEIAHGLQLGVCWTWDTLIGALQFDLMRIQAASSARFSD
jgi:hypothetical protein